MAVFTMTSSAALVIADPGVASSILTPSGLDGQQVVDVAVTLIGLAGLPLPDLDAALVHAAGFDERAFLFLSDAGSGTFFRPGVSVRFSDAGTQTLPSGVLFGIEGGTYLPTGLEPGEIGADFGLTIPLTQTDTTGFPGFGTVFGGQQAQGPWQLILRDDTDTPNSSGTAELTGWSLSITTAQTEVTLNGGAGADSFLVLSTSATAGQFLQSGGTVMRYSGVTGFTISGGDGGDLIQSGAGNDRLNGGTGTDVLLAGAGNDLLEVTQTDLITGSAQVFDGGTGTDRLSILATSSGTVDLRQQTLAGIEELQFSGAPGATLVLGAGQIGAGLAANALLIGNGNDSEPFLFRMGAATTLDLSRLRFQDVDNPFYATLVFGDSASETVTGTRLNDRITTEGGNDRVFGGAGNDNLISSFGNDTLDGGTGIDVLGAYEGDDLYFVDNAADEIYDYDGMGTDIVATRVSYALGDAGNAEIEHLRTTSSAGTSAINLTGNTLSQTITGNAGANVLSDGGGGADTLTGLGGNDTYIVRNSAAIIVEGTGQGTADRVAAAVSFTLAANDDIEVMTTSSAGGTTAINLTGNALAQTITGNAGANRLDGKGGNDTMTGGAGADSFQFSTALGSGNVDTITDYTVAADTIRLENAVFTGLAAGVLAAAAFRANSTGQAGDATDRIIYETDTGNLYFDADGTGAGGRVRFAVLDAGLAMTAGELVVF